MLPDTTIEDGGAAVAAGFLPPASVLRDENDARRYKRSTLAYVCLLYLALGLALANLIPARVLVVAVPLLYLRLALALHELLHVCSPAHVSWFHRLTMVFETPISLGYAEHRAVHFAHHRFTATDRDPEQYQIVGGPVRAFANALVSPERGFLNWVREHGVSRALALGASVRFVAFVTLAWINPPVFVVYLAALRLSVGFASFVFHHVLHNADGRLGTFPLPVSAPVIRAARVLFGKEPMLILTEHERHHRWPRVRARDLPMLPEPGA
jgi:hypothetical protein